MSLPALKWAVEVAPVAGLDAEPAYLLIALAYHHNPKHGCFPSQETLCARVRVEKRQLRRHLRTLTRRGLVKVQAWGRRNRYELNFDWAPTSENIFTDTGHICPQSGAESENMCTNGGHKCPQYSGHKCPATPEDAPNSGHKCPLVLKSKQEKIKRKGKLKVFGTSYTKTGGDPQNQETEYEEEPKPKTKTPTQPETPEDPVKVEDAIKAKMTPKTLPEIVNIYSLTKAKGLVVTGGLLGRIWKYLHELYQPQMKMTTLTKASMAQLKQAHDLADSEDFIPALAHVIEHWSDFVTYLRNAYDVSFKSFPMVPSVGVVLQYIQPVMQFHQDVKPKAKKSLVIPKVQQAKLSLTKKIP